MSHADTPRTHDHEGSNEFNDETTDDGLITLERIECNAACDFAPVVMTKWEFFDNQTPDSTIKLVDDLRSGQDVRPTRGPDKVVSFQEMSRVLAGFPDGRADQGPGAAGASLAGLAVAHERGWSAPGGAAAAAGIQEGDIVTRFNGVPITSASDLTAQVRAAAAGSDAKVTYVRGGKEYDIEVTLGELAG